MSYFVVLVSRVSQVHVVKQISTIVKESFVQRIIHIVLMESIRLIVSVERNTNEVRQENHLCEEENKRFFFFSS